MRNHAILHISSINVVVKVCWNVVNDKVRRERKEKASKQGGRKTEKMQGRTFTKKREDFPLWRHRLRTPPVHEDAGLIPDLAQ